jgi:hypothetical protein
MGSWLGPTDPPVQVYQLIIKKIAKNFRLTTLPDETGPHLTRGPHVVCHGDKRAEPVDAMRMGHWPVQRARRIHDISIIEIDVTESKQNQLTRCQAR